MWKLKNRNIICRTKQFKAIFKCFFIFLTKILVWPKSSFGLFHKILQKNLNGLFGHPNILLSFASLSDFVLSFSINHLTNSCYFCFKFENETLFVCLLEINSVFSHASCKRHEVPRIGNYTRTSKKKFLFKKPGTSKLTVALDLTCSF